MRYLVYIVTMSTYITIHAMRMTIPFLGIHISHYFSLDNRTLGLGNAISYIMLGSAYFLAAMNPPKRKKLTYLLFTFALSLGFLLIPVYTFLGINSLGWLFLSMAIFGCFQCISWSTILSLIHLFFSPSRDGCLLGIWGTSLDLGNSFGFILLILILYVFHWPWQSAMIIEALIAMVFAIGVYMLPVKEEEIEESEEFEAHEEVQYLFKNIKEPFPIYVLVHMALSKVMVYGILLWVPLFLEEKGLG